MTDSPKPSTSPATLIPRTVIALGLVSFFMDVSSEIVHGLLPVFMTTTLGLSVAMVGLIDGVAESTAAITKVFSGYISDRIGLRKPLILFGYGLSALTKPLFALASGAGLILGARFADRIGKGMRGAPRDALITDVTPPEVRGRAFGLRQAMDTAGAFTGPLLALGLMALFAGNMRAVFWVAVIPGALAVVCVLFGVEDRGAGAKDQAARVAKAPPIRLADIGRFSSAYWGVALLGVVFTLARFSEGFLVLKAHADGLPLLLTPLVLVAMNIVYAAGAYPAGALSDRMRPEGLLIAGLVALVAADVALSLGHGLVATFVGIGLWGVHLALTQGLLSKLVADHAPDDLRGSAFGLFNLLSGVALLVASLIAGLVWDRYGAPATFITGGGFAVLAAALVLIKRKRSTPQVP
ncbi:MAG: MFS transporter [Caulobacteraceae bacterium]|nr:MFS transporter [Caulobacteraceae bacterium]